MALSRDHLMAIFTGCQQLERFVLNCDIWCDSPVDDQLLGHLRRSCPHLAHLDLCPGNFQTTDQSLQILATFPALHYVRLVEFSGITELGLMHFLRRTPSLAKCTIEDCCDIHSENMIDFVRNLYFGKPGSHSPVTKILILLFHRRESEPST